MAQLPPSGCAVVVPRASRLWFGLGCWDSLRVPCQGSGSGRWVILGLVDAARMFGVLPGLAGPASLPRRACVRKFALPWGLCPGVVVSCGLWGGGGLSLQLCWTLQGRVFYTDPARGRGALPVSWVWRVLLPSVFAFYPIPVPFRVTGSSPLILRLSPPPC